MIHWIRAMVFELFAIVAIICLQLIGFVWKPKFSQKRGGRPILLVHGYINTSAVWIYIKWKLSRRTLGPIYTIDLKHPFRSMTEHAKQVEKCAERIEKETGRFDLILIGYSMGGIISSFYATHLAPQGKVTDVLTIASPFAGTYVAKMAFGKNGREMERGSTFLKKLNQEMRKSHKIRFSHIASKTDEIIIPYTSAVFDEKRKYIFNDLGHGALIFSPRVANKLISFINE
ncbi:MAG: alpha/beta fold hydrolase [Chlamydiales bacterium]